MERHGEPITAYRLKTLETGITLERGFGGLVPEIEERRSARFSGYSWHEWSQLPVEERVDCVAYHRIIRAIEANEEDAREKDARRKAHSKGKK